MNTQPAQQTHAASKSPGRIVTENPSLVVLLTENSSDQIPTSSTTARGSRLSHHSNPNQQRDSVEPGYCKFLVHGEQLSPATNPAFANTGAHKPAPSSLAVSPTKSLILTPRGSPQGLRYVDIVDNISATQYSPRSVPNSISAVTSNPGEENCKPFGEHSISVDAALEEDIPDTSRTYVTSGQALRDIQNLHGPTVSDSVDVVACAKNNPNSPAYVSYNHHPQRVVVNSNHVETPCDTGIIINNNNVHGNHDDVHDIGVVSNSVVTAGTDHNNSVTYSVHREARSSPHPTQSAGSPQHAKVRGHSPVQTKSEAVPSGFYDSLEPAAASNPATGRNTYPINHSDSINQRRSEKHPSLDSDPGPSPVDSLDLTPAHVGDTNRQEARDVGVKKEGSSHVYAVANPQILAAQGIPGVNNSASSITPRTQQAVHQGLTQAVTSAHQETPRDPTNSSFKQGQPTAPGREKSSPGAGRKSRTSGVSFQEPEDVESHRVRQGPRRDSVAERVPTPHPHHEEVHSPSTGPGDRRRDNDPRFTTAPYSSPPSEGRHSNQTGGSVPTVKRVYVDSPTFTREEEEQFRFVESRLEDEEDPHTTRDIKMAAAPRLPEGMKDSYVPRAKDRQASGPRYEDRNEDYYDKQQDRYEDRDYDNDRDQERDDRGYDRDERDNKRNNRNYDREEEDFRRNNRENVRNDRDFDRNNGNFGRNNRDYERQDRDNYDDRNYPRNERGHDRERRHSRDYDQNRDTGYARNVRERGGHDYNDNGNHSDYNSHDNRQRRFEDERYEEPNRGYDDGEKRPEHQGYSQGYNHGNNRYGDDEDDVLIKQETRYQEHLQDRLKQQARDVDQIDIPRLPIENGDPWQSPPGPPGQYEYEQPYGGYNENDMEETARMEVVNPRPPRYDFVENNKVDYGRVPGKSYSFIEERKKEAEKKLETVFVKPKPHKMPKAQSRDSKAREIESPEELSENASTAEMLWAKRSSNLKRKDTAGTGKSKTASGTSLKKNRALQKYPAQNGMVRQPLYQGYNGREQMRMYGTPTRNHYLEPLENRPSPPAKMAEAPPLPPQNMGQRRPLDLKPITQEIVTEDGQRISVDINLKVHSPRGTSPPRYHAEVLPGSQATGGPRPIGSQYSYGVYDDQGPPEDQYQYYQTTRSEPPRQQGRQPPPPQQQQQQQRKQNQPPPQRPPQQTYNKQTPETKTPTIKEEDYAAEDEAQYQDKADKNESKPQDNKNDNVKEDEQEKQALPPPEEYNFDYGQTRAPYSTYAEPEQEYNRAPPEEPQKENGSPNPYSKIPPIQSSYDQDGPLRIEMGYADLYKKERAKDPSAQPWYQVYTVQDYKRLKKELEANRAPLGPDLDSETFKEKVEKRHKQFEYARMVMEKNRQELQERKPRRSGKNSGSPETLYNKRRTALEYAKNVPKPTAKPQPSQFNSYEVSAQMSPIKKSPSSPSRNHVEVINIQKLQARHEADKQKVARIKENVDQPISQKG